MEKNKNYYNLNLEALKFRMLKVIYFVDYIIIIKTENLLDQFNIQNLIRFHQLIVSIIQTVIKYFQQINVGLTNKFHVNLYIIIHHYIKS